MSIPLVWSDRHRLHEPAAEIWVGVPRPAAEVPARAEAIRAALWLRARSSGRAARRRRARRGARRRAARRTSRGAWRDWEAAGLPDDPGQDRVVPYVFPHPGLIARPRAAVPAATWARAGYFAFDTMTLVGPGTWDAARAAVDVALTAADLVAGGAPLAYACCRPPGHHVTRTAYGGSCYLNNAAVAAQRCATGVDGPRRGHRHRRPSRQRHPGDLLRPRRRPHRVGARRSRRGLVPPLPRVRRRDAAPATGAGANLNLPLPPGAETGNGCAAVARARGGRARARRRGLVVALGVDAAGGDPESPLQVTAAGFRAAGRALGAAGLPTVVVQEGGYDLAAIGPLGAARR